jgi:hypothetical protein
MFVSAHTVEIWEMVGEKQTLYSPACLSCGWYGSDGTRAEAEAEARMHERGKVQPWIMQAGQEAGWEGKSWNTPT